MSKQAVVAAGIVLLVLLAAGVGAQPPYVLPGETEIFSFDTAKGRHLAICEGEKPGTGKYLAYRFGKRDAVELEYPDARKDSFRKFSYASYFRGGGPQNEGLDLNYFMFENKGVKYTVYEKYQAEVDHTDVGITIRLPGGKLVDLKARAGTVKGSLAHFRFEKSVPQADLPED
jgi:hypothetical protein